MNLDFFNEMLEIIKPDLETGPWIAGGYPMRIYSGMNLTHSDIDVFFKDQDQLDKVENYFNNLTHILEITTSDLDTNKSSKILDSVSRYSKFSSKNANTYTDDHGNKIQLIFNVFHQNLDSIFNHFDINLCKIATDGKIFIASDTTYRDIENKILNFSHINKNSLKRFTKYVGYGFNPSTETIQAIYANREFLSYDFRDDEDYQ